MVGMLTTFNNKRQDDGHDITASAMIDFVGCFLFSRATFHEARPTLVLFFQCTGTTCPRVLRCSGAVLSI